MLATQIAKTPVTIKALQAIMNSFKLEIRTMKDRINSKITESRSRLSSSASPTSEHTPQLRTQQIVISTPLAIKLSTPPPQLDSPVIVT